MELDPAPDSLIQEAIAVYKGLDRDDRSSQLMRGMISSIAGTPSAEAILDSIADDPELRGDLLVPLSTAATSSIRDFDRVVDLVKAGELPPEVVDHFSVGRISHKFDANQFKETLVSLVEANPDAAPVVLRLLSMFYYRDPERFGQVRDFVVSLVLMPEVIAHINGTMIGHSWKEAVQAILRTPPKGFVSDLATTLADHADSNITIPYNDSGASPVLRDLLQRFPKESWAVLETRLRDEEGNSNFTIVDLLCRDGRMDNSGVPLWELQPSDFKEWAAQNVDLMPYFLRHMPLYVIERSDPAIPDPATQNSAKSPQEEVPIKLHDPTDAPDLGDRYVWHPLTLVVVELCGKDDLLGALSSNIFSFSSTGSRVPYLEKRRQLMTDLTKSKVPDLKLIAQKICDDLKLEIQREQKNDAQRAAGIHTW